MVQQQLSASKGTRLKHWGARYFAFSSSEPVQLSSHDLYVSLASPTTSSQLQRNLFLPEGNATGITKGSMLPFTDVSHQGRASSIPEDVKIKTEVL